MLKLPYECLFQRSRGLRGVGARTRYYCGLLEGGLTRNFGIYAENSLRECSDVKMQAIRSFQRNPHRSDRTASPPDTTRF